MSCARQACMFAALVCIQTWPEMSAVTELATKIKKLRKGREDDIYYRPFVAVELKK